MVTVMFWRSSLAVAATVTGLGWLPAAGADWPWHRGAGERVWRCWPGFSCWPQPEHSPRRAGYDGSVSPLAAPTDARGYVGYYVGGGAALFGEPRQVHEGTWGWDYQGVFLPRRVMLRWWHGRKYQGGTGQYRSHGPISPFAHPPHPGVHALPE
jgi:hypothetical protein